MIQDSVKWQSSGSTIITLNPQLLTVMDRGE
jgi:hypothetical protein